MVARLSFFGLGKLGLPLAALFARSGLSTVAIDIDTALIDRLQAGAVPFVEPGLEELLREAAPEISYASDASLAGDTDASVIFVATPSDSSHPAFSSAFVEQACRELCAVLRRRPSWRYHLVIIASTLHPGTISSRIYPLLEEELARRAGTDFGVAYVPEFVALGEVISGFQRPPFLLIGCDEPSAGRRAAAVYSRILATQTPIRFMSTRDAELAKIALNVFLCVKISYANSLLQLSHRLGGADLDAIASTLSLDPRIGAGFLLGGGPYGGACLPRDTDAFLNLAKSVDLDVPLVRGSAEVNAAQYDLIEREVLASGPRCVALIGLSFKAGTPVTIGSLGFEFVRRLRRRSIEVLAFDPLQKAREAAHAAFGSEITCCNTLAESLVRADAILVCNRDPTFAKLGGETPADRRIVDPWGCVQDEHPGLIRLGRITNRSAVGLAST